MERCVCVCVVWCGGGVEDEENIENGGKLRVNDEEGKEVERERERDQPS